jgi:RING finger protein 121
VIGLAGYIIILFIFFGLAAIFTDGEGLFQFGILLLAYGLYFG